MPSLDVFPKVSGGVVERSRLLAQLTDELETVKAEMEERGRLGGLLLQMKTSHLQAAP